MSILAIGKTIFSGATIVAGAVIAADMIREAGKKIMAKKDEIEAEKAEAQIKKDHEAAMRVAEILTKMATAQKKGG